jgi:hypothetical protein
MKYLNGEKWVTLPGHKSAYGESYAISSHGRLVKYKGKLDDGEILKCSMQEGYPIWRSRKNGEHYHALLHRLVAKHFLPKPGAKQNIIIHINFKKTDNHYKNLKWATQTEAIAHQQNSPAVKKLRKYMRDNPGDANNAKLTVDKVKQVKRMLKDGKTLKFIAAKYKVSDMQIHRIKTGENWSSVKI